MEKCGNGFLNLLGGEVRADADWLGVVERVLGGMTVLEAIGVQFGAEDGFFHEGLEDEAMDGPAAGGWEAQGVGWSLGGFEMAEGGGDVHGSEREAGGLQLGDDGGEFAAQGGYLALFEALALGFRIVLPGSDQGFLGEGLGDDFVVVHGWRVPRWRRLLFLERWLERGDEEALAAWNCLGFGVVC